MTFIIKVLTLQITSVIIAAFELTKPGETEPSDRCEPPMKALTFKRYGKSPEIGFSDVPRPALKANELLVQVHAASVNPIDNMIPTGIFKAVVKFQLPATMGSDLRRRGRRGRQPGDPLQGG